MPAGNPMNNSLSTSLTHGFEKTWLCAASWISTPRTTMRVPMNIIASA